MSRLPIRVVKVGGSLFDLPDLATRFHSWVESEPPAHNVAVAGGGDLANVVRAADALHSIGEVAAHWMCVDCLSVTTKMLSAVTAIPNTDRLEDVRSLFGHDTSTTTLFDVEPFLKHEEPRLPGETLSQSWHVTTDSIAARLAVVLAADELVLLKSRSADAYVSIDVAIAEGYIDAAFSNIAPALQQLRCVNFRDQNFGSTNISLINN